ncbi:hypothetical protein PXH78_09280 [Mycolicibacterium smegmatis]|uniref:hypothetical protein n=1 Tax=Mycolicibacterium smegmatis TaxID=1772 RepID=UPI0005D746CB|nr:hypothetical protein [Mycolicibacterium smegmatis]MDF1899059.1 hypothetical protein [Mycolicibacterium smegmatis]MDF1904883.1 hypothetical protein [Mycolicibacterium smegmatis]MDF1918752.1 hypothetical protein [Mycolicibacterium smegmatis]MDF1924047.1 hypothetical protein [Mycolicibacterium smegmatis]UAK53334.1 hypothetical protein K8P01_22335 [Mycolicibacterium smegmatis]
MKKMLTLLAMPVVIALAPLTAPQAHAAIKCEEAPAKWVEAINWSFTKDEHLTDAKVVTTPDGALYIGGNIVDSSGTKVSSADVWLLDGALWALSSDARKRTVLPDGRDLGVSAGDEYGSAVQDCVTGR